MKIADHIANFFCRFIPTLAVVAAMLYFWHVKFGTYYDAAFIINIVFGLELVRAVEDRINDSLKLKRKEMETENAV